MSTVTIDLTQIFIAAVTLTDVLPATVAFVSAASSQGTCSGSSIVTCSIGTLANLASASVTVVVKAQQPGNISNTASVVANEFNETTGSMYPSTLFEIGLVLLGVTVVVNALAQLLLKTFAGPGMKRQH